MTRTIQDVRFSARAWPGTEKTTLASDVYSYACEVRVVGMDGMPVERFDALDRWLDMTFPARTVTEWVTQGEDHDCPTCTCEIEDVAVFEVRLPGASAHEVERAVSRLRLPDAFQRVGRSPA